MAGEREELHYVVSSKATMTHMKLLGIQNFELWVSRHIIPLTIPFALFCRLFCSQHQALSVWLARVTY